MKNATEEDIRLALPYLRSAADQEDAAAAYLLYTVLQRGVTNDEEAKEEEKKLAADEARKYLRIAAEGGVAEACLTRAIQLKVQ